jgi:hypothetical protein
MIEINDYANSKLFSVVGANVGRTRSYGSSPIHYWYRNVVEALRLIDNGFEVKEGRYRIPLEKSLGVVYYDVRYIGNDAVYIVTDFDFNFRTIRSYLNRTRTKSLSGTTRSDVPLYSNPSNQIVSSYSIGHKIECCRFKDGTIRLQYKGRNIALKSQFDKILSPFRRLKDGEYAIGEKNGVKYKLFVNDTTQAITESVYKQIILEDTIYNNKDIGTNIMKTNKKVVRLSESKLRNIITESIKKVLSESNGKKKLENSFKSKEDMTRYRDMYTSDDAYDESNSPYLAHSYRNFDNGYDYCGDDEYNDYVSDYNRNFSKRLATKGGQMSFDWEHRYDGDDMHNRLKNTAHDDLERYSDIRSIDNNKRNIKGRKLMNRWLKSGNDDVFDYSA